MKEIALTDLDLVLNEVESLVVRDFGAAMNYLGGLTVNIATPIAQVDPFSATYADWVMSNYIQIAGIEEYNPIHHEADNNVQPTISAQDYFPFLTRDTVFVGKYLVGVGMVLANLELNPSSRVVEYGVGWGHLSNALARIGHSVMCVDIEAKFLELAKKQARQQGLTIETYHGSFGDRPFRDASTFADAVIFFEAFHHAFDHQTVLRKIRDSVLAEGGILILAAEPVHPHFPFPWGVRQDGHAVWSIRRHKWMELGFREDYLIRLLMREGFIVDRVRVEELGIFGLLYRGKLHTGRVALSEILLPDDEARSWISSAGAHENHLWATEDSYMTIDMHPKWNRLSVSLRNYLPIELTVRISTSEDALATSFEVAPGMAIDVSLLLTGQTRQLFIYSQTAVPSELGVNNDIRRLGIAVEHIHYHESSR